MVLNKPWGLAVQGGSGTYRHIDGMLEEASRVSGAGRLSTLLRIVLPVTLPALLAILLLALIRAMQSFEIELVLKRLLERGRIVFKRAYCDWTRFQNFMREFHLQGFEMVDIPRSNVSGKNSADIHLVVDALELCHAKQHIDVFALLTGEDDILIGDEGDDVYTSEGGMDIAFAGAGLDKVIGGLGFDFVSYARSITGAYADLTGAPNVATATKARSSSASSAATLATPRSTTAMAVPASRNDQRSRRSTATLLATTSRSPPNTVAAPSTESLRSATTVVHVAGASTGAVPLTPTLIPVVFGHPIIRPESEASPNPAPFLP